MPSPSCSAGTFPPVFAFPGHYMFYLPSFLRLFVLPKFRNHLIFYQPFQKTIVVVRALHAAQDWTRFF